MRIIAYDRFKPGVTMKDVTPYLPEEVANVWRLWKAGIVRENYARDDVDLNEPFDRTRKAASGGSRA